MTPNKRNRYTIVVDSIKDCSEKFHDLPLVEAAVYLSEEYTNATAGLKLLNLCHHNRKLSAGYYVSLLAEAREHRCLPEAATLHALSRNVLARDVINDLQDSIDKSFERLTSKRFTLSVYFGENLAESHLALSKKLYNLFPSPLVRYDFIRETNWRLSSVHHLGLDEIPEEHLDFVHQRLAAMLHKAWQPKRSAAKSYSYEIAILANPKEKTPPSDNGALKRFIQAAETLGMRAELITPRDFPRLLEFDALFIRETTRLDNHTYRFANKAARFNMLVIDDPESIRRCCNKVYLSELLHSHHIPAPESTLLTRRNYESVSRDFNYPIILKIPDGSYSIGVHKAKTPEELTRLCRELFSTSSILLAQAYVPTEYDWRIGIIDGKPIYACRYFMSKGHWQIYNHSAKGKNKEGDSNCVPISEVPQIVIETATNAANLIGKGFYGVDLKHVDGKALVIEVNDNPSVDAGVEDELIGEQLYLEVMSTFLNRLRESKAAN